MTYLCIFNPSDAFSVSERRELASFPEISAESIGNGTFMKDFEIYASERFPYRDVFRGWKALVNMNVFNKMDNNGIFVADGHISKIDDSVNETMLNHSAEVINGIYDKYLKNQNVNAYFSVIPDKNFILAEENSYPQIDYNAFAEDMKNRITFAKYIDVANLLQLEDYYTTDTHWKQEKITDVAEKLGSEMGTDVKSTYKENVLDIPFYGVYTGQLGIPFKPDTIKYLTNDTLDNCKVIYYNDMGKPYEDDMYNMEKANGKDPYEMFLSGSAPIVIIENDNAKTDKELYLFRDSFGSSLAPLMAEGYKKITVIDVRYVQSAYLGAFIKFTENSDALFIYSTTLLNSSMAMK